MKKPALLTSL